jgi:hypothetical protein
MGRKSKISKEVWDVQPFGLLSDAEIGKRLGVSGMAVTFQRWQRGRPSLSDMCGGYPSKADFEAGKPLNLR